MSTISRVPEAACGGVRQFRGPRPARMLQRWWLAYTAWRMERWAIGRLGGMSDRQLKDIGLVRSQIKFAVKGGIGRGSIASRRA